MSPFPCRRPVRLPARPAHEQSRDGTAVPPDVRERPKRNNGHAPGVPHPPPSRPAAGAPFPAAAQGKPVTQVCRSGRAAVPPDGRGVRVRAADVTGGTTARVPEDLPVTGPGGSDGVTA